MSPCCGGKTGVVALFGATGATGRAVITASLERGLHVHAFHRPTSSLDCDAEDVVAVPGELSDPEAVARALHGSEMAVLAFGPRAPYRDVFCEEATRAILAHAREHGPRRIVLLSGAMIGEPNSGLAPGMRLLRAILRRRFEATFADRAAQEHLVRESGLAWTIVKPSRLTSAASHGRLKAGSDVRVGLLSAVTRADLAHFLLDAHRDRELYHRAVFVRG